jgi:hypothetical protein
MDNSKNNRNVSVVAVKFKKRGILSNEFIVRLSSKDFSDTFTINQLINEGYNKYQKNALSSNFILSIPQRLTGYGKYIGFNSSNILAVYIEKDKGRIDLNDIASHILLNNETIIVEYYDRNLTVISGILAIISITYFGFHARKYIHYRIHKND